MLDDVDGHRGDRPAIAIGSLVLNVANRDAGTLAVMAATLQEVSDGRLLLGLGARWRDTPYASEQEALGRTVAGAPFAAAVEGAVGRLRGVWSGSVGGVDGFLRPDPAPPVIIGGFGPKMAEIAGRLGDGSTRRGASARPTRRHRAAANSRDATPGHFVVTASAGPRDRAWATSVSTG